MRCIKNCVFKESSYCIYYDKELESSTMDGEKITIMCDECQLDSKKNEIIRSMLTELLCGISSIEEGIRDKLDNIGKIQDI